MKLIVLKIGRVLALPLGTLLLLRPAFGQTEPTTPPTGDEAQDEGPAPPDEATPPSGPSKEEPVGSEEDSGASPKPVVEREDGARDESAASEGDETGDEARTGEAWSSDGAQPSPTEAEEATATEELTSRPESSTPSEGQGEPDSAAAADEDDTAAGEQSGATSEFPRPILQPEVARPPARPFPRTQAMPGDYVARPVTLPRGTFRLEFGQGLLPFGTDPNSALAPAFGWGVTEWLEVGVDAPLHYDPGIDDWAALHPRPALAVTWIDEDEYEFGTRARGLVPARDTIDPSATLQFPLLWRATDELRVDLVPAIHSGFAEDPARVARVDARFTWQALRGLFAGLGTMGHIGLGGPAQSAVDLTMDIGLTYQNHGRAYVDFVSRSFVKSVGGGEGGSFSRGIGTTLALIFYPELY